ncbi:hypothetical protein J437_LFUL001951 [Ladona fulva]|uniref:Immunoglobulin domain-containing protein n=1 Tax=Ladona fulva TaxID=123851 RepID=A0A8K0NVM8_LADFU|nr:hypothetical protein J437_LFUL001951 [Ladona fulva]
MTVVSATTSASGSDQSGGAATGNAATPSIFLPTASHLTVRRGEDATFSVRIAPGAATPTVYSWVLDVERVKEEGWEASAASVSRERAKKGRLGKEDDIVGGAPVDRYRIAENNNVISLTLHHVTCDDAGVYTLVAKGEPGGEDLRSTPMELSVLDTEEDEEDGASGVASGMDKGEKPVFLRTLSDLAVKVGTRTRFLVEIRSPSELKSITIRKVGLWDFERASSFTASVCENRVNKF